jgi:hypothetical protein
MLPVACSAAPHVTVQVPCCWRCLPVALTTVVRAACSYGVLVLIIEIISSTATFGYAILLVKYSKSRRTKGLPIPKKGQQPDLDNLKFHVRVLVPCYKESMELVRLTGVASQGGCLHGISHKGKGCIYHCTLAA